jgi:hypothetical protein
MMRFVPFHPLSRDITSMDDIIEAKNWKRETPMHGFFYEVLGLGRF